MSRTKGLDTQRSCQARNLDMLRKPLSAEPFLSFNVVLTEEALWSSQKAWGGPCHPPKSPFYPLWGCCHLTLTHLTPSKSFPSESHSLKQFPCEIFGTPQAPAACKCVPHSPRVGNVVGKSHPDSNSNWVCRAIVPQGLWISSFAAVSVLFTSFLWTSCAPMNCWDTISMW